MTTVFETLIVFLAIAALMYFAFRRSAGCCGGQPHADPRDETNPKRGPSGRGMQKDPVCGMEVQAVGNPLNSSYKGQNVYFCSARCKERFDEDPERFTQNEGSVHQGHAGCCG